MLSAGAVTASLIAVPVFRAAGGSGAGAGWPVKITLGLWALPALAAAVLWLPQTRYRSRPVGTDETGKAGGAWRRAGLSGVGGPGPAGPGTARARLRRHPLAWQVAAFMGLQSLSYYAALSWLPTLLRDRGVSAAGAGQRARADECRNLITGLLVPVLAQRARDQRLLVAATVAATVVGLAGVRFAPASGAAAWMLVLGLGQGSSLGLAIFFTMARAPDPVTAASLSAFAQSAGYLLATAGPLAVGFLHTATGGWTVPVLALIGTTAFQLWAGLLSGRDRTLPAGGVPS